jgi:uncharacterized glyoxalase superfamily protein PhnB
MSVHYLPEGYNSVNSYLITPHAEQVIEFLKAVFDAEEVGRLLGPDGKIGHAEVQLGNSRIMLSTGMPGSTPSSSVLVVYVPDTDATYARAIAAGAESVREPADQFYGDRSGGVKDSAGNQWWIHTHIEDVSFDEVERRAANLPQG